jgi:hypothetical protein
MSEKQLQGSTKKLCMRATKSEECDSEKHENNDKNNITYNT